MKTLVNSLNCRCAAWALALCALLISAFALRAEEVSIDLVPVWEKDPQGIQITGAKFSPDGNFIYCAIANNIRKLDAKTGEYVSWFNNTIKGELRGITYMDISQDGKYIATINGYNQLYIWDAQSEKIIREIKVENQTDKQYIESVSFPPNGSEALFGLHTEVPYPQIPTITTVVRYNIENNKEIYRIDCPGIVQQLKASQNGKYFATGSMYWDENNKKWYDKIFIWEMETGKYISPVENVQEPESGDGYKLIKISQDSKYLGWIRKHSDGPYIYDLEKNVLIRTTDLRLPTTFEFLPDSLHYAVYFDWEGQYALEIRNIKTDKKVYSHVYGAQILESVKSIDGNTYLYDFGDYFTRVFKVNKTIGVINPTNESNIEIVVKNNKLFLKSAAIEYINVSISDIRGKEVFKTQIKSHIKNELIPLDIILNSGVYLCRIVSDTVEYTQKIEIVR